MSWTPEEAERIATLEADQRNISSDIGEIKASLTSLKNIAAQGSGALKSALKIGAALGWLIALMLAAANYFHK